MYGEVNLSVPFVTLFLTGTPGFVGRPLSISVRQNFLRTVFEVTYKAVMKKSEQEMINEICANLQHELDEWVGNHYPDEGTEDFDRWQRRLNAINEIENVEDIYAYAAEFVSDEDAFFEKWGL